ncbi:MAG: hypothetical protein JJE52_11360 [Acidimicrobiia bacterium]|nr:hypothetical protein [Acidimicrobiia bacterium]
MELFTASDLSRRRREVLDAARHHAVLIRDTDGLMLRVAPAATSQAESRLRDLTQLLLSTRAAVHDADASPAEFADLAWIADWPVERRVRFHDDFADTLALALSLVNPAPVEAFLDAARPKLTPPEFDAQAVWDDLDDKEKALLTTRIGQMRPRRRVPV